MLRVASSVEIVCLVVVVVLQGGSATAATGPWEEVGDFPSHCEGSQSICVSDCYYVMEGAYNHQGYFGTWYCELQGDGSLGPWNPTTSRSIDRFNYGLVSDGQCIYLIGGMTLIPSGQVYSEVEFARIRIRA